MTQTKIPQLKPWPGKGLVQYVKMKKTGIKLKKTLFDYKTISFYIYKALLSNCGHKVKTYPTINPHD